jgi:hypothetical protein
VLRKRWWPGGLDRRQIELLIEAHPSSDPGRDVPRGGGQAELEDSGAATLGFESAAG